MARCKVVISGKVCGQERDALDHTHDAFNPKESHRFEPEDAAPAPKPAFKGRNGIDYEAELEYVLGLDKQAEKGGDATEPIRQTGASINQEVTSPAEQPALTKMPCPMCASMRCEKFVSFSLNHDLEPAAGQGAELPRLKEIRERCEKATAGPWVVIGASSERNPGCGISSQIGDGTSYRVANTDIDDLDCDAENANAAFIAHARADIPYLLEQLKLAAHVTKGLEARLAQLVDDVMGMAREANKFEDQAKATKARNLELMGELERARKEFTEHTKEIGKFLNELCAIMVDPLAEGTIKVAAMCDALKGSALASREFEYKHQGCERQLAEATERANGHWEELQSLQENLKTTESERAKLVIELAEAQKALQDMVDEFLPHGICLDCQHTYCEGKRQTFAAARKIAYPEPEPRPVAASEERK